MVLGRYCVVQSVWFWLVLSAVVSLVLDWYCVVQSVWSDRHCIVQSVWHCQCNLFGLVGTVSAVWLVGLVWFDLLGTGWCGLVGLV